MNRPISLKEFAQRLPLGMVNEPTQGRFVFGSRMEDTLPYLVQPGARAELKPDEAYTLPVSLDTQVCTFDLSDPADREEYQGILHAVAAGMYKVIFVERHWDEEKKNMRVYIEYLIRYRVIKPSSEFDVLNDQMNHIVPRPIK